MQRFKSLAAFTQGYIFQLGMNCSLVFPVQTPQCLYLFDAVTLIWLCWVNGMFFHYALWRES